MNNLYLEVNDRACNELKILLKKNPKYNLIRIYSTSNCCKINLEAALDKKKQEDDVIVSINHVDFIYNKKNLLSLKKVTLLYEDNKFLIKGDKDETIKKDCSSCDKKTSSCSGCSSGCHNNDRSSDNLSNYGKS